VNLVEVMQPCAALLASWGGHPMAVGVSLDPANLNAFREMFCAAVLALRGAAAGHRDPAMELSAWLEPADLGEDLLRELDLLHPFGEGNPEPIFGVRGVRLTQAAEIFSAVNYRCRVPTGGGRNIPAVAWRKAAHLPPAHADLDFAAKFHWNCWNGRQSPQLEVLDWRAAE
jgi:single-stranded-DNA-specific exonuclease